MKNKVVNLINVKSIVTIMLSFVFAYLAVAGIITGGEFLTVFTTVIAFYFGVQHEKREKIEQEENKDNIKL